MHSHNLDIDTLLDTYLPVHYSTAAIEKLAVKGVKVSADVVRNARNGRRVSNKAAILAVLVEIAQENKKALDNLNNLVVKSNSN